MAYILTELSAAGMRPKFAHGALVTREGVVLPPLSGSEWAARNLTYNPLSPGDAGDDDD